MGMQKNQGRVFQTCVLTRASRSIRSGAHFSQWKCRWRRPWGNRPARRQEVVCQTCLLRWHMNSCVHCCRLASDELFVRSPFRKEHLVVVPRKIFSIYANSAKMSRFVPSCPVPSCTSPPPLVGVNSWLLVLAWDNWSTWSINVYMHIYGISGKVSRLSHPIPTPDEHTSEVH